MLRARGADPHARSMHPCARAGRANASDKMADARGRNDRPRAFPPTCKGHFRLLDFHGTSSEVKPRRIEFFVQLLGAWTSRDLEVSVATTSSVRFRRGGLARAAEVVRLQLDQQHLGVRRADVLPDVGLGRDPHDVAGAELPIPAGSVGEVEAPVKGAQRVED
jgi:hypothetical protein